MTTEPVGNTRRDSDTSSNRPEPTAIPIHHAAGVPPRPPKPNPPMLSGRAQAAIPFQNEIAEPPRPHHQSPVKTNVISAPNSTGNSTEEESEGILLDFGDSQTKSKESQNGLRAQANGGAQNMDLLADLFGTSSTLISGVDAPSQPSRMNSTPLLVNNDDIFADFTIPVINPVSQPPPVSVSNTATKSRNILDDLDLFGNETQTSSVSKHHQVTVKVHDF